MPVSLDAALGIHGQALALRGKRSQVLASNLANDDTPNYKARDMDFAQALKQEAGEQARLRTSDPRHLQPTADQATTLKYRQPLHPALDGNTVDGEQEKAAFTENAVRYQASLLFLNRRLGALRSALRDQN